jgi:phage protein U
MSYSATVFKVMIASPSDVFAERNVVREVLSEWNVVHAELRQQVLLPIGWDTHATPQMGDRPQSIINKQVLLGCDVLVGIFWTRIGTTTMEYASGTVEEIEEHIKSGRPAMLYFSSAPVHPDNVDAAQYRRLKEFRSSCQSRGLCEPYSDIQDFRSKFYRHLQLTLNRDAQFQKTGVDNSEITSSSVSLPQLSREGVHLLKQAALATGGEILLLSHIGGQILQVGSTNLIEDNNDRSRAVWTAALEELEARSLVRAATAKRNVFRVTKVGYELADTLP